MLHEQLDAFIADQREQLPADENNYFGLVVFGDVSKYYRYVLLIMERHRREGSIFLEHTNAHLERQREAEQGVARRLTPEEERELEKRVIQTTRLHLEIESFFIFASILLDRIAGATQYYFGAASKQWKSFEAMKDYLWGYAENKGLSTPPDELLELAKWLHSNVSVFRHELLVHKHEDDSRARVGFGTGFDNMTGETFFSVGIYYPEEGEEPKIGERPEVILAKLNIFIDAWINYLKLNESQRNLQPAPKM